MEDQRGCFVEHFLQISRALEQSRQLGRKCDNYRKLRVVRQELFEAGTSRFIEIDGLVPKPDLILWSYLSTSHLTNNHNQLVAFEVDVKVDEIRLFTSPSRNSSIELRSSI